MLKAAGKNELRDILDFCSEDLIGTRIACYCLCYGFDKDFFSVWVSGEDKTTAVVAKFYDSITIKCDCDCDFNEIKQFVSMLGYNEIMCSEKTCKGLDFKDYKRKKAYVFCSEEQEYTTENLGEEYYKQLYSLISEAIPGSFKDTREAYLSFLSDFTYRKRRDFASIKGITENGELLSCVMTSSETNEAAIISGVACKSTSRKTGLGKRTVLSMVKYLMDKGKRVYVIALNESAQGFYEHIGFSEVYNICFINDK